ncbi:S41 family peptidase [Acidomonas methanolica]|uniref:Tricorn protease homolog n=1 Tax=Acidomonas methanolica NBRC 104435 TaxID=1231351 RepID=A0A023D134_ACIMT|nr:S41 family peptidase [Acidomonas methanolica]MBU2655359.1 PDZ domain-containing protein [Acidomonas methanolica]TCS23776.1 tricorn protease [Acidomonas methanolica]GAJ27863.1 hypothetical protein Amme_008_028 [Acidomonas methanolica NBRC 104435]GBQ46554.1 peptidase S41 [Acidomonas methanolica]GEL00247.1 tricorn protease [Acidomonas methanolica NBRC 104435]
MPHGPLSQTLTPAHPLSRPGGLVRLALCAGAAGLALWMGAGSARAEDGTRALARFPAVHGERIVFVAHGNLWSVGRQGGLARRLTSDPGQDFAPRFSPDGKWIAFTASYEGNEDVYVIPAEGGPARRLTFHSDVAPHMSDRAGPDNLVVTWTPDSRAIVFLSRRQGWNPRDERAYTVPLAGGLPQPLPVDGTGFLTYGPDGHSIAMTRIYRDFRTWKRYNGGMAQNVFRYDLDSHALKQLTDWSGTSTQPMWAGNVIYFLSDHAPDRRANLWAYEVETGRTRQVTHFTDFDVDFPSLGDDGVVFQQGGALWMMDLPSETVHRIDVAIPDDGTRTMPRPVATGDQIRSSDYAGQQNYALSPNGKRAALVARGDVYTLPAEHGAVRNLTASTDADDEHPVFSPDGALIAYTSDAGGEQQIWLRPAAGGAARALTRFKDGYRYGPLFSPDGRRLAFSDNLHRLWIMTLDGEPVQVAQDRMEEIHDQAFSSDGKYLAFSMHRAGGAGARGLFVYDIARGTLTPLGGRDEDSAPQFSGDGRFLYFLSKRIEKPLMDDREFNGASVRSTGIYVAPIAADGPSPFPVRSDESGPASAPKDAPKAGSKSAPQGGKAASPDFEHLLTRAVPLPGIAQGAGGLTVAGDLLFYATYPAPGVDDDSPEAQKPTLHSYDLAARKDETVLEDFDALTLSYDGKTMLFNRKADWFIADAKPKAEAHKLATDGMTATVTPPEEWAEAFREAWRLERDFFYNPKMNGVDWTKIRDSYARFLPLLGSAYDSGWLLGQIQGELGNSHTYAQTAPAHDGPPAFATPLLGADFALDEAAGRYRLTHILKGDNTRPDYRAPLAAPGIDVKDGDWLLAVDGRELRAPVDPYSLFVGKKGPVTLTVASELAGKTREVTVEPVASELSLREAAWIEHNRETVDRLSHGQVAYIYLSDMEALGMQQFIRQFYTQLDRRAVIIDDRWNGGGNVDEILLERLRRVLIGMSTNRLGFGVPLPAQLIAGPKVTLLNHYSASDGDMFPYYFREYGLGKLIGTRSWGGVRGIRGMWPLIDGSSVSIPEDALYDLKSQWVIENHGVDPDLVVENTPADLLAGHDRQLETAVSVLMKELADKPAALPAPPAWLPPYPPGTPADTHHD